jgi:hypothetical protein
MSSPAQPLIDLRDKIAAYAKKWSGDKTEPAKEEHIKPLAKDLGWYIRPEPKADTSKTTQKAVAKKTTPRKRASGK